MSSFSNETADDDHRLAKLIDRLPTSLAATVRFLRQPSGRWLRTPAGLLLILGGLLFFLPILGTAGGVASGIDFALHIAAEIVGEETAQAIQLSIEYDPAPLFTSGHPDRAPASVTALVAPLYAKRREAYRAVLQP
jgi:hypothetical protein